MPSSRVVSLSTLGLNDLKDHKLKLHYRIVILGSAKVGKTSIVRRLLSDKFEEIHKPTIEELYQNDYKLKDSDMTLTLDLLDTSGSYPFPAMRKLAISTGDAFVLVYAIDDLDSFEEVTRLKDAIIDERATNLPPIVTVGNKSDLVDKRMVKKELAETIINIDWEMGFVECSAKNNENILLVFKELLQQKQTQYILQTQTLSKRDSLVTVSPRIKHRKIALKPQSCIIS
ncbi:dexamethasone-induced Ras-related protein 1-like [Oppia nitens]|uniref:dexamethasone-induced Ras-related protein 1-like n=1 Tax=Oppia nitens TaxID=1686743 RepID=UPI0023D9FE4B|nr:dexamethasone-induced Ras-related protein 1-like [Oppia nitens]